MAKKMPDILLQDDEPEESEQLNFELDDGTETEEEASPPPVTRAEIDELRKKADSTNVVADALAQLAGRGQQAPAVPEKQVGETQEQFKKRVNDAIFSSDDPYSFIAEVAKREVAPYLGQQGQGASTMAKKLMELDPEKAPTFKKYKKEIEELVAALPPEQRILPQVWEYAHTQVSARHITDIQTDTIDKLVEERLDKKLRDLGIDPEKVRAQRPGVSYSETGGTAPATKRKVVRYTQKDVEAADRKGLTIEDYLGTKRG